MADSPLSLSSRRLISGLTAIVGQRYVLTAPERTRPYCCGFRLGSGPAVAVVMPRTLLELWRVLQICVEADHIVITQASNTGLTGGSTPYGTYDRAVVVVSTTRISAVHIIAERNQVICLAGTTLYTLERALAPLGREPHSVIGSSCIGASVVGGICNNSGGALARRGPAYTEYALFARVDDRGQVRLENRLGIRLGSEPENVLTVVESGSFSVSDIDCDERVASDRSYASHIREVNADTPARFNADGRRLFDASGSAGRIVVFAVRLDTFAKELDTATFYIGTNSTKELTVLRRRLLTECNSLPISGEYIHRDAFDIAEHYGKDIFLAIRILGTDRLPKLFGVKSFIDRLARRVPFLPSHLSDRLMQRLSQLFPQHLPRRMIEFRKRFEHYLILKVASEGISEGRKLLASLFPSASGDFFQCSSDEAEKAMLHRFAVAGAAIRYRAVHPDQVEDIVAVDIALPRSDRNWFEKLPADVAAPIIKALYYGHFLCHVFHQDYIVRRGTNALELEHRMWQLLDTRGAQYPAEHNVGHLYRAASGLANHYKSLDPGNRLNPGIGQTSRTRDWS